jgi:DNA-directed RNA polymerase I and III subunit RPAC1
MTVNCADSIESAGQYEPEDLIPEAIKLLLEKIDSVEKGLDELFAPGGSA